MQRPRKMLHSTTKNGKHRNVLRFTFVHFPVDFFIRHESAFLFAESKSWLGRHFFHFVFSFHSFRFYRIFHFLQFQNEKKSTPKSHYVVLLFVPRRWGQQWHGTHVFNRSVTFGEKIAVCYRSRVHVTARYTYLRFVSMPSTLWRQWGRDLIPSIWLIVRMLLRYVTARASSQLCRGIFCTEN